MSELMPLQRCDLAYTIHLMLSGSVIVLEGYPTGAPPVACNAMGAGNNTTRQLGDVPHVIGVSSETYCTGQNIILRVLSFSTRLCLNYGPFLY